MTINWKLLEKLNKEVATAIEKPPAAGMFLNVPVSDVAELVRTIEDQDKKLAQAKSEYAQLWNINQEQADKIDKFTGAADIAETTKDNGTASVESADGPVTQADRQSGDPGSQEPVNSAQES